MIRPDEPTEQAVDSVFESESNHVNLPRHDLKNIFKLALSVRNDLRKRERSSQTTSLNLNLEHLNGLVDYLENVLEKKIVDEYKISSSYFSLSKKELKFKNTNQALTQLETEIMLLLCKNLNMLVDRDQLLNKIWGHADFYTSRSLDVYIHRLRKYISCDPLIRIETVHRKGFKLCTLEN